MDIGKWMFPGDECVIAVGDWNTAQVQLLLYGERLHFARRF